jgi:amino acid/peptide:H+ symporter
MWERFSYYGMRALLVLYLVNALRWGPAEASNLYGTYTAAVFLTPLIGGWLADKFIGTGRSLVIGGLVIAAGHFMLAFAPESAGPGGTSPLGGSMAAFYGGLLLVVIGTGFFKPNVSTMVGQLYRPGDDRRDAGFTIFYMGVNLGAFLAPLVCGYLGQSERFGWHYGFGAAGVGMLLGLLTFMWGRNKYLPGIGLRPGGERPDLEPLIVLLYRAMYEAIAMHSRLGLNVVVDVGHHHAYSVPLGILPACARQLQDLPVLFVGVRCPLDVVMERRRATWGGGKADDGAVPQAVRLWQQAVHVPGIYDLEIDTSVLSPEQCADLIRQRLEAGPPPSAFQRLAAMAI